MQFQFPEWKNAGGDFPFCDSNLKFLPVSIFDNCLKKEKIVQLKNHHLLN
jgi:hypothetical protein